MITLRDYQETGVNELRAAYGSGKRAPLLVAPTGSGKTVTFAYIADNAARKRKNVLILVHRKELLTQTSRTLDAFGVGHGMIAAHTSFNPAPVQVASVQTLVRRLDGRIPWRPDLIVVDEAHHATGKTTWGRILKYYPCAMILGVTATPERLDGQGLGIRGGGFFDCLVMGPTVAELVKAGHLSPPVVYAPYNPDLDLSGVHTKMGDFSRAESAEAVDKPTITGNVVTHYRKHCNGEPAIAFCVSVAHAEHVAASFNAAGLKAASIDGKLPDDERSARISALGAGQLNVLTSCEIISEGTDIPIVSAALLLRPTQSLGLYLQQVGRVLRPHPGKTRAVVLDHVGNVYRHGLPDDDREWSLDASSRSKRKKDDEVNLPIRQCEKCYHVHRPAPECPNCGFVYEVKTRQLEVVEGELEEVSPEALRRKAEEKKAKRRQGQAVTLLELHQLAEERGYKPEWADFVWNARQNKSGSSRKRIRA